MPRYIAIYKGYNDVEGLQREKDYQLIAKKDSSNQIIITVVNQTGTPVNPLVYASDWEFLKEWQILRTWLGSK